MFIDKPKNFVVSDTHWNHVNILSYQKNRSFPTLEEMNEAFIAAWNKTVSPGDIVYHLGDFAMGQRDKIPAIIARLNGTIRLVKGNHDTKVPEFGFDWVKDYHSCKINGQYVVMSHFPMLKWDGDGTGAYMLHGHCHGNLDSVNKGTKRLDVGIDAFCKDTSAPREFDEVYQELKDGTYSGHH